MAPSKGSLHQKNSWIKGSSPGWAAFDLKERQKQGKETPKEVDIYPLSISNAPGSKMVDSKLLRSFTSVVQTSAPGISTTSNQKTKIQTWAEEASIEDILLTAKKTGNGTFESLNSISCTRSNQSKYFLKVCPLEECTGKEVKSVDIGASPQNSPPVMSGRLSSVPAEPEWEEDDIYLTLRRDAINAMRSSSRHFLAASNAYTRGDHYMAKHLSTQAHTEWTIAEKLNTRAAKEVLRIKNYDNDPWTLDLHGLHASEAVNALKNHLTCIESWLSMYQSVSLNVPLWGDDFIYFPQFDRCSRIKFHDGKKPEAPCWKQTFLYVVTGTGNHSHGHASLPMAVRAFLLENRYSFRDARAGVFAVQPKFRHH